MVGYRAGQKIGEEAMDVQRKTLKDLEKSLRTFAQDH